MSEGSVSVCRVSEGSVCEGSVSVGSASVGSVCEGSVSVCRVSEGSVKLANHTRNGPSWRRGGSGTRR